MKPQDWTELQQRWPGAYSFIVRKNLIDELYELREIIKNNAIDLRRRAWCETRIAELETLKLEEK